MIKSSFHVEVLESEGAFLLTETAQVLLRGKIYSQLVPLLDGGRTVDELVIDLGGTLTAAEVYYALGRLEQQGYLAEGGGESPLERTAFWTALNLDAASAGERLGPARVGLATFGAVDAAPAISALAAATLQVVDRADFWLALSDDYLQDGLAEFNTQALKSGSPWLLAKPVGMVLWVGPLFRPNQTGCWECLAQRLAANREVEAFLQERLGLRKPFPTSRARLPAASQVALGIAATEAARCLGGGQSPLEGALLTIDLVSLETRKHVLTRRPQCPSCGDPAARAKRGPAQIDLECRPKRFTADGGHRVATPDETLKRYAHHISPITGAVRLLERSSSEGDELMHSYVAGHNAALGRIDLEVLRRSLRSNSGGKGMTDSQARASGLCEALERHSGSFRDDEPRLRSSFRDLGDAAIHPNLCALYSERQFRERERWNVGGSRFQRVPHPFDEEREIDWTPVWSLTRREFRYLPTATTTIRSSCKLGTPGLTRTATRPATRAKRPFCRAFWSLSSETASRSGGTTGCAVQQ